MVEHERRENDITTSHTEQIKSILGMIKRMSEDINILSERILANNKTPTQTILSVVSLGTIIAFAFGAYFQTESKRQEAEIKSLRSAQSQALYEAGRNEATRDRIMSLEKWTESHDLRVRGLNSRQDETLRWLEKLDDKKLH